MLKAAIVGALTLTMGISFAAAETLSEAGAQYERGSAKSWRTCHQGGAHCTASRHSQSDG